MLNVDSLVCSLQKEIENLKEQIRKNQEIENKFHKYIIEQIEVSKGFYGKYPFYDGKVQALEEVLLELDTYKEKFKG